MEKITNISNDGLRAESHINFHTQCVIMRLAGRELSLITFWNPEKLSNLDIYVLKFASLIFIHLSMEKNYLSAKK